MNGKTDEKLTGLILARGGSKEIPLKNLALVGGKPLLVRAITAMKDFGRFESIWVSTDNSEIERCALQEGVQVYRRSEANAKDCSKSIDAVHEFLNYKQDVRILCLVQCTSPFLQSRFLNQGCDLILRGYDSVFSGSRDKKFRWKVCNMDEGKSTEPINLAANNRLRRQDREGEIVENGMFYFTRRKLLEEGVFQGGRIGYVEIPAELSLEVDTKLDLIIAQQIHQHFITS
eukprot:TRINITY_DN36393_c0_g1_i4.p1 TRINITY_DN36393_c0_g1~~TRINITY_DN36393_c0_g1_i4.p1  ORF type:complete len:231 (+),score=8.68 TRINITY_DN36393_c0_g1_i4:86-778(+)